MSRYKECPTCHHKADGGLFGGVYIQLHKCRDKDHRFCNNCKNGDRCPLCGSADIWWDYEQAYTDK